METNKNTNKKKETKIILPELSYKIMGVLFSVQNQLGSSLLEKYYQRAVAKGFEEENISFKKEIPVNIYFKDQPIGKYILDFIVEDQIVIETKATQSYNPKFFKQTFAYLKETNLPLAILVNFRRPKLEYKRIVNPNYNHSD